MRRTGSLAVVFVVATLAFIGLAANAADKGTKAPAPPRPDIIPFDDPQVLEVMKKIDAAGAYATPPMNLKKDENRAGLPRTVSPSPGRSPSRRTSCCRWSTPGPAVTSPSPSGSTR
jgi:hypothetical protein